VSDYRGPELLLAEHVIAGFDCGDDELNRWLARKALRNRSGGGSRTWVVSFEGRVVGFYASSTAVILRAQAPGKVSRNQPEPIPAVLLARLATDVKHHRKGLGDALLKHFLLKTLEVAQVVGVRVVLVHAANDTAGGWYEKYGFEPAPFDDHTMMLLVANIEHSAR